MNVGQAGIASGLTIRQSFVVKTHQPQDGRVQIVQMHTIFDRLESNRVGRGHLQPRNDDFATIEDPAIEGE